MSMRRDFPDLPPVWAAGTVALQWVVAAVLPILRVDGAVFTVLGWGLVGAGFGLALWSLIWFRRKRTTFEPRDTPTALIVEGPFRINRNPIYSGVVLILVGTGFLFGSVLAVLLALPFAWIITRRFIAEEEATLRAAFGEDAERYIERTRRW